MGKEMEVEIETLAQEFLKLGLDSKVEILDVACGTGVVAAELREAGYHNVDGLDPSQGYLNGAMAKGIFRKVFRAFIDPESPTEISDNSYDALLCCAGFFQGLISPKAFVELIRITKPGGIITWNIAMGYESYHGYENYDDIIMGLVRDRKWEFAKPVIKHSRMSFTDCGSSYLRGWNTDGGIQCEGYTYTMRKL